MNLPELQSTLEAALERTREAMTHRSHDAQWIRAKIMTPREVQLSSQAAYGLIQQALALINE